MRNPEGMFDQSYSIDLSQLCFPNLDELPIDTSSDPEVKEQIDAMISLQRIVECVGSVPAVLILGERLFAEYVPSVTSRLLAFWPGG